jgi:hypothetical protein
MYIISIIKPEKRGFFRKLRHRWKNNIVACLWHVATINVDSPGLTRKFIGTIAEITRNEYNTHFHV